MNELKKSIENLYNTFSKYTTEGIYHCDCGCINKDDVKKLSSKPLRQLEEADLVSYHGSALYTWGDVEHYKHYLPRICELRSQNRNFAFINLDELFTKLEYAKWRKWPEEEQQAINDYVQSDWIEFANERYSKIEEDELKDYEKFLGIDMLLRLWNISSTDKALQNFVFFFYYHGAKILNGGRKIEDKKYVNHFLVLIEENELASKLHTSFFENEKHDTEYADKISVVLQMIEQHVKIKKTTGNK